MSNWIVLFLNLISNILEIIWMPEIFDNFSSCKILIFQMIELIFFIFKIRNFWNKKFLGGIQIIIERSNVDDRDFGISKLRTLK